MSWLSEIVEVGQVSDFAHARLHFIEGEALATTRTELLDVERGDGASGAHAPLPNRRGSGGGPKADFQGRMRCTPPTVALSAR